MRPPTGYQRVLPYFRAYRSLLIVGVLFVVASRALMGYAPRILRDALNTLETGGDEEASLVAEATAQGWTFFGITVAAGISTLCMRWFLVGTSRKVERDLKRDLFDHVGRLPSSFFDRTRTGDLIARLTSDVEAVRFSLGPGLMYVGGTAVLFPVVLTNMMQLSSTLAMYVLIPLCLIALLVRALGPGIMRRTRAVQQRIGDLSARAQESFAGARVVRAYATEDVEESSFHDLNEQLVSETLGLARFRAFMQAGLYVLGGLGQVVILWYGGSLVMHAELARGDLVAFLAYVGLLIWPMISIGWVVSAFQRSAAAMERINEVMNTPVEAAYLGAPTSPPMPLRGAIDIKNLTFSYPEASLPALEDVTLRVEAGQTLGLVGPVGSGKSTLLALLSRQYNPPAGTIFLDGVDGTRIPLHTLRAAFAVVPQDAFLFSTSLLANLSYATDQSLAPERAMRAVALAGLADDLETFPRGLETVVGERGLTLSGGQKQRVALARALLRDRTILLLDDCLSAVDTKTEDQILASLTSELHRKTAIIVAHRLSTVTTADHIVVLDQGRIVEQGTHATLLQAKGWYAETYAQQRLAEELGGLV